MVWVDESGCYLLPTALRTYAPRGQTPSLDVPLSCDHLSIIGGQNPPAGRDPRCPVGAPGLNRGRAQLRAGTAYPLGVPWRI